MNQREAKPAVVEPEVSIPQAVSTIAIRGAGFKETVATNVSIPQAVSTIAIVKGGETVEGIIKFQYRKR